jgi:hypothetical protein
MKKLITTTALFFAVISAHAQYDDKDSNRIGIAGGINSFMLDTDNFEASPEMGWNIGLSVRGNFYNNWDMVYQLQFSENNFTVVTTNPILDEDVKFKLSSAQVSLLLSYSLIENHLSVEFGPMFQINGKLTIPKDDEDNIVKGTTHTAEEITDISRFQFYPTIGVTAGLTHIRVNVTYQYGVTNVLNKLNDKGYPEDFKGHAGIVTGSLIIYL